MLNKLIALIIKYIHIVFIVRIWRKRVCEENARRNDYLYVCSVPEFPAVFTLIRVYLHKRNRPKKTTFAAMGKITVKHYLNTNLKPYIINGDKYFSIYVLVTANRQNTKVKSNAFNEYYSEKDFAEIINPKNKIDLAAIRNEETAIINIASLIISELEIFDTTLFAAIYNHYKNIFVWDLDIEFSGLFSYSDSKSTNLFNKDRNRLGIDISDFLNKPLLPNGNGVQQINLYEWYSSIGQLQLRKYVKENSCIKDMDNAIEILNKIVFYKSFQDLKSIIERSKKYEGLIATYDKYFNYDSELVDKYYQQLSI